MDERPGRSKVLLVDWVKDGIRYKDCSLSSFATLCSAFKRIPQSSLSILSIMSGNQTDPSTNSPSRPQGTNLPSTTNEGEPKKPPVQNGIRVPGRWDDLIRDPNLEPPGDKRKGEQSFPRSPPPKWISFRYHNFRPNRHKDLRK